MSGTLFVDVNKIKVNILDVKEKTKAKFCAVVKANAYGIGIQIAKYIDNMVDYYAVACVSEANELARITQKNILILSPPNLQEIAQIAHNNICFAVDSIDILKNLAKANQKYNVHICVNTGMNRFGTDYKTFCKMLNIIKTAHNIELLGVFSHFYADDNYSKQQANLFNKFERKAHKKFANIICHIANSQNLNYCYDMVRVGIGLYGKEQECLTLQSAIKEIRTIQKGQVVSYNVKYCATKTTKIAVVPLGYADGISRNMTGKYVLVAGTKCQIVGSVCMDCFMVDVSSVNAKIGDKVIIFGQDNNEQINVCQIALWCDTICYEILTRIGSRVQRKYICKSSEENIKAES